MNVEPVDLRDELWQGVQPRFDLTPIIFGRPILRERLNEGELHALRKVRDGFPLRKACCDDTPSQVGQFRLWNVDMKRTNRILFTRLLAASICSSSLGHDASFRTVLSFGLSPRANNQTPALTP